MKKTYFYALAAALTLVGCSKEVFVEESARTITLTATVENDSPSTKVSFDTDGKFSWSEGDNIGVMYTDDNSTCSFAKFTDNNATGTFTGTIAGTYTIGSYAVYPYNESHSCTVSSGSVSMRYYLPASYTYSTVDTDFPSSGSTSSNSFNAPMLGTITDNAVSFTHLAGVFCLKFDGCLPNDSETSYTLTLTSNKQLTGDFELGVTDGKTTIFSSDETTSNNSVSISYQGNGNGASGVFYIPAPVGTHDLTIEITSVTNGGTNTLVSTTVSNVVIEKTYLKKITTSSLSGSVSSTSLQDANTALADGTDDVTVTEDITSNNSELEIPATSSTGASKTVSFTGALLTDLTVTDASASGTSVENINLEFASTEDENGTSASPNLIINTPNSTTTVTASSTSEGVSFSNVTVSTADYTFVVGNNVVINTLSVKAGNVYLKEGSVVSTFTKDESNTASTIYVVNATDKESLGDLPSPFVEITPAEYELHKVCAKGGNLTLTGNVTGDFVVSAEAVTIDLGGHTVTNKEGDTFTVNNGCNLTIRGSGTVDNITNGKACIYNNGILTLNGGTYTRSEEASTDKDTSGGNSYYNILNHGTMTIGDGVSITSTGHFASLIDNGYYSYTSTDERKGYVEGTGNAAPSLTINGGTFYGGINTVKNDDNATLTITGGSFENVTQAAVQNNNVATISGGTFEAGDYHSVETKYYEGDYNAGKTTITGGTFTGDLYVNDEDNTTIKITGGTFSDPMALNYLKASAEVTVKLTKDVTITKYILVKASKATAELYLNGHTITNETDYYASEHQSKPYTDGIHVNKGTLNIYDDANLGGITCGSSTSEVDGYREAIETNGKSAVVNIYGGHYQNHGVTGQVDLIYAQSGTINIYGGTFESSCYNESGYWLLNCLDDNYTAGTAKINVMGGKFVNFNPKVVKCGAETNFVADGYTVTGEKVNDTATVDVGVWCDPTTTLSGDIYYYVKASSSEE